MNPRTMKVKGQVITAACNKCNYCLHDRRMDWCFRIKEHIRDCISGSFVTLTYDNEHLPLTEDGKYMTLKKSDLIRFHKNVRQENTRTLLRIKKRKRLSPGEYKALKKKWKISYYSIGEYGSRFHRPHYHLLLFNMHPLTLQAIQKQWPKGMLYVGSVTGASVNYVTSYLIEPFQSKNPNEQRQPRFNIMSKGIGSGYLIRAREWHRTNAFSNEDDKRYYAIVDGVRQRLPRYYKERLYSKPTRKMLAEASWDNALMDQEEIYLKLLKQFKNDRMKTYKYMIEQKEFNHDLIRTKVIQSKKLAYV